MLRVLTSTIRYRGPDRLDITRGSGGVAGHPFAPSWPLLRGVKRDRITWYEYVPAYLAEMADSQECYPKAWAALLARPRVVLVCYCPKRERCHRGLLAELLVGLGAVDEGEVGGQLPLPLDPSS